jgi:adenosylcobinamide-phosphate synthase
VGRALAVWARDRRLTDSPNAGHPMATMAGALGVELEKAGHYRLGAGLRSATAADIDSAVRIMLGAALAAAMIALGIRHAA